MGTTVPHSGKFRTSLGKWWCVITHVTMIRCPPQSHIFYFHVVIMTEFSVIWCSIASGGPLTLWVTDRPTHWVPTELPAVWWLYGSYSLGRLDSNWTLLLLTELHPSLSMCLSDTCENMKGIDVGMGGPVIYAYKSCYVIWVYDILFCYLPLKFLPSKIYDGYEFISHLQLRNPSTDEWIVKVWSI